MRLVCYWPDRDQIYIIWPFIHGFHCGFIDKDGSVHYVEWSETFERMMDDKVIIGEL